MKSIARFATALILVSISVGACSTGGRLDPQVSGAPPLSPVTVGIPASDTAARDAIREAADPLYGAARSDPSHFDIYSTDDGGLWRIVVRYVQGASLDSLQSLVPAGAPVEWVPSKYSWSDLRRIQDEISSMGLLGTRISTIGVDSADNAVMVEMPVSDPELQQELTTKYGDAVRFGIGVIPQPL